MFEHAIASERWDEEPGIDPAHASTLIARHLDTRASSALLLGAAGRGKSHVLGRLAERIDRSTFVRVSPADADLPLSGIATFASAFDGGLSRRLTFDPTTSDWSDVGTRRMAAGMIDQLASVPSPPAVVLVDDIDRMDALSLSIIGIALPRLDHIGVRLVASASVVPAGFERLSTFALSHLGAEDAERIAAASGAEDEMTRRILLSYCGDVPQVIERVVGALDHEQRLGHQPVTLPPRFAARYGRAPAVSEAEEKTLASIALAAEFPIDALARAAGEEATTDDLIDRGILRAEGGRVRIADPLLRSAVLQRVSPAESRHRRAALVALLDGSDPSLAAWHWSFLTCSEDSVTELLRGAAAAVRQRRLRLAVEMAERAYGLGPTTSRCADRAQRRLVEALLAADEMGLAARYGRWAFERSPEPTTRLSSMMALTAAAIVLGTHLHQPEVEALTILHGDAHPVQAAIMNAVLAAGQAERDDVTAARARTAVARGLRAGERVSSLLDDIDGLIDALAGRESAPRVTTGRELPEALLIRARIATVREDPHGARHLIAVAQQRAAALGRGCESLALIASVRNEISSGEIGLSISAVEHWARRRPWSLPTSSTVLLADAWRRYGEGDLDGALGALARALEYAQSEGKGMYRAQAFSLRGAVHLVRDDPQAALADLRSVSVLARELADPLQLRYHANYVQACLLTGNLRQAQRVVEELSAYEAQRPSAWSRLVLDRTRAMLAGDAAADRLAAHVERLDGARLLGTFEGARSLLALAEAQAAVGRAREAHWTASHAATVFDSLGAAAWAAHLRRDPRLQPQPEQASAFAGLTDQEREIVALVADGLRNREIAARLFLAMRTVELRLTSIYRAVGVHSRSEMMAMLGREAA